MSAAAVGVIVVCAFIPGDRNFASGEVREKLGLALHAPNGISMDLEPGTI